MPKVKLNGNEYLIRWTEEQDSKLLSIGSDIRYKKLCRPHKQGYREIVYLVNWKLIEKEGALKGLPKLSLRRYSQRLSLLLSKIEDPNHYKRRRRLEKSYAKKHPEMYKKNSFTHIKSIWETLSDDFKKKRGYTPRKIWTEKQKRLLVRIVKCYTRKRINWKSIMSDSLLKELPRTYRSLDDLKRLHNYSRSQKNTYLSREQRKAFSSLIKKHQSKSWIDWESVMSDPRIQELPEKYHDDLHRTRKYYWSAIKQEGSEEYKEHRRSLALEYKKKNLESYRDNKNNRVKMIRNSVNEYLYEMLEKH